MIMSTYSWVLLLAAVPPVLLSFDKRVAFYKKWKYLFPAIMLTACCFITWDSFFTIQQVWGFNPSHIMGKYLFHLPLEEILFFAVVPYASLFTYEVYIAWLGYCLPARVTVFISCFLILLGIGVSILFYSRAYTAVTFIAAGALIAFLQFYVKAEWMRAFYIAWVIILVPFSIVNGILTGSLIHQEVVWYNPLENMGIRLGTIPMEDFMYGLLLLLLVTSIYEWLKKKY
jgi:lycopene cyclase domain-containing protein